MRVFSSVYLVYAKVVWYLWSCLYFWHLGTQKIKKKEKLMFHIFDKI